MPHLNCSVPLCVASTRRTPNLRFYRLPKEPSKRERWLRLIRNDSLVTRQTVSQWTSVCSLHFTEIPSKIIPECHEPEIFPWCPEWPDIIRAYNDEVTSNQSVSIAPLPILTPENTGTNWTAGLTTGETHSDDIHKDVKGHGDTSTRITHDSASAVHQSDGHKKRKNMHTSQVINGDRADDAQAAVVTSAGTTFPVCELMYTPVDAISSAETSSMADKTYYNPYHSPQVMSRLCELWRLGQLCDAILCIGNTVRMTAHRVVLAAVSPFVLSLCSAPLIGSCMEIKLPSGLNIDAVHKVLTYMYEGSLCISQSDVKAIWKVALLLKIDAVVGFCEEYMRLTRYTSTTETGEPANQDRKRKFIESNMPSTAASVVGPLISGGYLSKNGQSMPVFMPLKKDRIRMNASTNEAHVTSHSLKHLSNSRDALDLAEIAPKCPKQKAFSQFRRKRPQDQIAIDTVSKREEAAKNLDRILSRNIGLKKETVKSLNNSPQTSPSPLSGISKGSASLMPLMESDLCHDNSDSPVGDRYYSPVADDEIALDMSTTREDSGDDQHDEDISNREGSDRLTEDDTWQTSGNSLTDNDSGVADSTQEPFTVINIKQEVMDTDMEVAQREHSPSPRFSDQWVNESRINQDIGMEDDDRCTSPSLQLPSADAIQVPDQLLIKLEPDDTIEETTQPDRNFPSFIVDEQAVVPDRLFASASLAASMNTQQIGGADSRITGLVDKPKWVTLSSRRAPRKYKVSTTTANSGYEDVLSMSPFSRGIIIENLPVPDDFLNSSNPEQQRRYMASCLERPNVSPIPEKNRQYRCSFCPSFFIKAKSCVGHVVETHDVQAKDVLSYISIANRKSDITVPNVSGDKDDQACDECSFKGRQTTGSLEYHKHIRHGMPLPPGLTMHKCHTCDKKFTTKYYWRQHLLTHEGVEQYVCEVCGQGFRTSQLLRYHSNKVHRAGSTAATKHYIKECDECGRVFHHLKSYQSHLRAHEREMLTLLSENMTRHETREILDPMSDYAEKDNDDDFVDEEENSLYEEGKPDDGSV